MTVSQRPDPSHDDTLDDSAHPEVKSFIPDSAAPIVAPPEPEAEEEPPAEERHATPAVEQHAATDEPKASTKAKK